MPICKRDGFDNLLSKTNKEETFQDKDEVFFCEVTKEIFRDYEDYFRHVMVINSTVWQCEATRRENLTYAEALKSERHARKKMELFKDIYRPPVMMVIKHSKQSSLKALCAIIWKLLRCRFFINEEVTACYKTTIYHPYVVVKVVYAGKTPPANGVYEETDKLRYLLKPIGKKAGGPEVEVPFENIRRLRQGFSTDNLYMYIKNNITRVDGILHPNPETYKKYVTDRNNTFDKIFLGNLPYFTPSKIKRPSKDNVQKKQSSINKYLVKSDEDKKQKLSAEDKEKREKEMKEKVEQKEKTLKEKMERARQEKLERLAEMERQKAERRVKLMEKIDAQCEALLTKTDDLERTDQYMLPNYSPVQTYIPDKLVGDAFMLSEFMHSFVSHLSGMDVFRGNITFMELSRAFTIREVAGPLSDIIIVLLGTIFDLQKEEEEECAVEYLLLNKEARTKEPLITMSEASRAHFFSKRHYYFKINELPSDELSLSEVLRLHLLSSGAIVKDRTENWRVSYRNGYSSSEDPGLELRMRHPHILRALKMYPVYALPFVDIMRILRCLQAQILTYSSPLNTIEERMDESAKARMDIRNMLIVENRRAANIQAQKRNLAKDLATQLLDKTIKSDPEKKRQLEEKVNKKVAELTAINDQKHRKYLNDVEKINSILFNHLIYLGMDRAYRKYYILESMPGIFIEHPPECFDVCLSDPPKNVVGEGVTSRTADLPKNRKDLRNYLIRYYHENDKSKQKNQSKAVKTEVVSQENKENHENQMVNGLTNGHDATNGIINKEENDQDVPNSMPTTTSSTSEAKPPSQYELFMCTGDPHNCIVHDERNKDRQRWSYIHLEEDIEALIASLNPLGERENSLREQLVTFKKFIIKHTMECPVNQLTIDDKSMAKFKSLMLASTSRKYSKSNFGFQEGADLSDVLSAVLADRIIRLEDDIYTGDLGNLKVKDMEKWRKDIVDHKYDAQGKLHWGPGKKKLTNTNGEGHECMDVDDEVNDDEDETDVKYEGQSGKFATKPYRDPSERLGDTMEIDSEDSSDEGISLHDSATLKADVKNLASALLQVEQAIERRFFTEPFGAPKDTKDKEAFERLQKLGADRLAQWEVSLMESTSYAQVFLHLNILHDAIIWARSTNKSSCQVCRRVNDPEEMLLCDQCNGGTHMYCMKPKMKNVPEGNWYCMRCVKNLGLKNETTTLPKKRKFIINEEEDNVSETSSLVNGKRPSGRASQRSSKQLQEYQIEKILTEPDDEDDAEETEQNFADFNDGSVSSDNNEDDVQESDDQGVEEDEEAAEEDEEAAEEEENDEENDESVCVVCSYDGSDLTCGSCKDTFHLECVNLKRAPRYNFICSTCKSKEDKKRSHSKIVDDNSSDETSESDSEDEQPLKRPRHSQKPLQSSLPNGKGKDTSQGRRSRRTGDNLPLNSSILYELLEDMIKHEHAWPFLRPVTQAEVPDYFKIIKQPMDLAKVKSKLNMGKYQLNEEVMKDVELIFHNCDTYNECGNEIYLAGSELEKFVISRCKELNLPFKPSDMNDGQMDKN